MVDKGTLSMGKKRRGDTARTVERTEMRIVPARSRAMVLTFAGTVLGGFLLGAGTYGQWMASSPMAAAPLLACGGAAVLVGALVWGGFEGTVLRVGDAGIAWEQSGKVVRRVAWYEMQEVGISSGVVRIVVDGAALTFAVSANPVAVAWLAKEAKARLPARWKADKSVVKALPTPSDDDGERLVVEPMQVAGRVCRASKRPITFEQDASFCRTCGEVYLKEYQPKDCIACNASLKGGIAVKATEVDEPIEVDGASDTTKA